MRFTWDEKKRLLNLRNHKLDFANAHLVFDGPTFTFEDDRFSYTEQRLMTLGFLNEVVVSLVHTENEYEIRCISFRLATKNEEKLLFESLR
jgi:uncharacterized protein